MKPPVRVQVVWDRDTKPKTTIPRDVMKEWGFPKKVVMEYDPGSKTIYLMPSEDGNKTIVDPMGKAKIIINKHIYEDMGKPSYVVLFYDRDSKQLAIRSLEAVFPKRHNVH